jgi:hypothetical protein
MSELIHSVEFELKRENLLLELHLTAPGEEFRLITQLQRRSDFVSASLNFLGLPQANELSTAPGTWNPPEARYFKCTSSDPEPIEIVQKVGEDKDLIRVATIDAEPDHCKRVMRSILEGFASTRRPDPNCPTLEVIGLSLTRDIGDFIDLHGYSELILKLTQLTYPISAINMSVDYGVVCLGHDEPGGTNPLPRPISMMSYAFPFFENILNIVRDNLTFIETVRVGDDMREIIRMVPVFCAPAGNRSRKAGAPRCRLAYPAVRPETITATFVTQSDNLRRLYPHESADIPSTYDLKPCIGFDPNILSISEKEGTSFASAWLTGTYMGLATQPGQESILLQGPLSKVGRILLYTRLRRYDVESRDPRACVSFFTGDRLRGSKSLLLDLIVTLNKIYKADFAVTGSMVMIEEWLQSNGLSIDHLREGELIGDLGDIDVVFAGSLSDVQRERAKEIIRDWLKERIGRRWISDSPYPVHLHAMEGRISSAQLLQSIVPVSHLFLTEGGLIDVWGAKEELSSGAISIILLEELEYWVMNPYFLNGSNSLALGILQWLNSVMLLNLLAARTAKTLVSLAQASLSRVRELLESAPNADKMRLLFGGGRQDPRERLLRRFDRAQHLLARNLKMKNECKDTEWILDRLKNLHSTFCQPVAG